MSYLPGPVDLKKAEQKQWVKVGPQKVEKKAMSKKWVLQKLKKSNVEKVGSYMLNIWPLPFSPLSPFHPRAAATQCEGVRGVRGCGRG